MSQNEVLLKKIEALEAEVQNLKNLTGGTSLYTQARPVRPVIDPEDRIPKPAPAPIPRREPRKLSRRGIALRDQQDPQPPLLKSPAVDYSHAAVADRRKTFHDKRTSDLCNDARRNLTIATDVAAVSRDGIVLVVAESAEHCALIHQSLPIMLRCSADILTDGVPLDKRTKYVERFLARKNKILIVEKSMFEDWVYDSKSSFTVYLGTPDSGGKIMERLTRLLLPKNDPKIRLLWGAFMNNRQFKQ